MIARRRASLGLSQADLARRLGRSQALISRWEAGKRLPNAIDLIELGRELDLEPDALVCGALSLGGRSRRGRYSTAAFLRVLGQEIRRARRDAGVSPMQVFSQAGIAPPRLRSIELGAEPSPRELQSLSALSGLTLTSLIARARTSAESAELDRSVGAPLAISDR